MTWNWSPSFTAWPWPPRKRITLVEAMCGTGGSPRACSTPLVHDLNPVLGLTQIYCRVASAVRVGSRIGRPDRRWLLPCPAPASCRLSQEGPSTMMALSGHWRIAGNDGNALARAYRRVRVGIRLAGDVGHRTSRGSTRDRPCRSKTDRMHVSGTGCIICPGIPGFRIRNHGLVSSR